MKAVLQLLKDHVQERAEFLYNVLEAKLESIKRITKNGFRF